MNSITIQKPEAVTSNSVYSNYDHELELCVVEELIDDPLLCAPHAAWDFCGYVWHHDGKWYEQVWQYRSPVEILTGDSVMDVINQANERYGSN